MPAGIYRKYFFVLLLVLLPAVSHVQAALININIAGTSELQTLSGIGPAYAQRIIDYRNANGPFEKIEDIKNVSGIGNVTFSNIKDFITVGVVGLTTEPLPDSTSTTTNQTSAATNITTTTTSSRNSSNIVTVSTHYSAAPLTNTEANSEFEVGAGRPRMSTIGTPVEFNANTNASYVKNVDFKWSFGDGTTGTGQILAHTYAYPGEYIVVLNATSPDGVAVSRTSVSVVLANLSVTATESSRIEVANNSFRETNLYGRALVAGGKIFTFPRDTIIKAGQKISFSTDVTGLEFANQSGASLIVMGTEVRPQEIIAKVEKQRLEKIVTIRNEIAVLEQRKLSLLRREVASPEVTEDNAEENEENSNTAPAVQTALVLDSVPESKSDKINGWLDTLKRFFLRTQ